MNRYLIVLGLVVAAFLGGYVPTYLKNRTLETEARQAQEQLQLARLHVQLGMALVEVEQSNFGKAREISSAFFDKLREAAAATGDEATRQRLEGVLGRRDEVTAELASLNQEVASKLRKLYLDLDMQGR